MPNFYYTDTNGQKQGAISPSQLKELVAQGIITPDTLLETDTGHKGFARQIKGLFDVTSTQPAVQKVKEAVPSKVSAPEVSDATMNYIKRMGYDDVDYEYRRIAAAYRLSTWSILLYFSWFLVLLPLSGMTIGMIGDELRSLCLLGTLLAAYCFSIVCMVRLGRAIQYRVFTIVLFAICLPMGILGLIPLITVYFYAARILKQSGYHVGFFGFGMDMQQFDDD